MIPTTPAKKTQTQQSILPNSIPKIPLDHTAKTIHQELSQSLPKSPLCFPDLLSRKVLPNQNMSPELRLPIDSYTNFFSDDNLLQLLRKYAFLFQTTHDDHYPIRPKSVEMVVSLVKRSKHLYNANFPLVFSYVARCNYKDDDFFEKAEKLYNGSNVTVKISLLHSLTYLGVRNYNTMTQTTRLCEMPLNDYDLSNLKSLAYIVAFQIPSNPASHRFIQSILTNHQGALKDPGFLFLMQQAALLTQYPPILIPPHMSKEFTISESTTTHSKVRQFLIAQLQEKRPGYNTYEKPWYFSAIILVEGATVKGKKIAIETIGPNACTVNTLEKLGETRMKINTLQEEDYHIVEYPFTEFYIDSINSFIDELIFTLH